MSPEKDLLSFRILHLVCALVTVIYQVNFALVFAPEDHAHVRLLTRQIAYVC